MTIKESVRLLTSGQHVYMGLTGPARITKVRKIMTAYFRANGYVPGFPDVHVITSQKHKKSAHAAALPHLSPYALGVHVWPTVPSRRPELAWIDDVSIMEEQVRHAAKWFRSIPIIFSGGRPDTRALRILADTREQKPMWSGLNCKCVKLEVGDYTTELLLDSFHIERKSPQDLYSTIIGINHVRFRNELIRAKTRGTKLVLFVECSREIFIRLKFDGGRFRKMKSETLRKVIETIESKYGLEMVWSKDRDTCRAGILKRLKEEQNKLK